MKKMTCKECGEEFELLPGKPGFANVCPQCSELGPEDRQRQIAAGVQMHKALVASVRKNANQRKKERQHEIKLEQMGYKVVRRLKTIPVAEQ